MSPINQWIEASSAYYISFCHNFNGFLPPDNLMLQFKFIHEQMLRHLCFMMILSLALTKHRRKQFGMEKMLEWPHEKLE